MQEDRIRKILEPLAAAANVTQADHANLGTVLLTLAYLYQVFDDIDMDEQVRERIQSSIERRWKKVDREMFILALVFNPYIRTDAFAETSTFRSIGTLYPIVVHAYKRLFNTTEEPNAEFRRAFSDYLRHQYSGSLTEGPEGPETHVSRSPGASGASGLQVSLTTTFIAK
jgi:hypothetical protein